MARDMVSRRLAGWRNLVEHYPTSLATLRDEPAFRVEEIEKACAAFGLSSSSPRDLGLLLGILADVLFPTLTDNPLAGPEYRAPAKPLIEMWISGSRKTDCSSETSLPESPI